MTKTPNPAARAAWKLRKRAVNALRGTQVWQEFSGWGRSEDRADRGVEHQTPGDAKDGPSSGQTKGSK